MVGTKVPPCPETRLKNYRSTIPNEVPYRSYEARHPAHAGVLCLITHQPLTTVGAHERVGRPFGAPSARIPASCRYLHRLTQRGAVDVPHQNLLRRHPPCARQPPPEARGSPAPQNPLPKHSLTLLAPLRRLPKGATRALAVPIMHKSTTVESFAPKRRRKAVPLTRGAQVPICIPLKPVFNFHARASREPYPKNFARAAN